jgi:hypothetical protein
MAGRWVGLTVALAVAGAVTILVDDAHAGRRTARCCTRLDAGTGTGPDVYCFTIRVKRRARTGKRGGTVGAGGICRLVGGTPDGR